MKGFSIKKKTPHQKKLRETEEEKRKRADEEAAKVYEEFVESFKAEDEKDPVKTFVRGGTVQPGTDTKPPARGVRYMPPGMAAALAAKAAVATAPQQLAAAPENEEDSVFPLPVRDKTKTKTRAIDKMLENLKREQELREERARLRKEGKMVDSDPWEGPVPGSFDDGDPNSTNLFVGNLAPSVTEDILLKEFSRFGPVASVKIMWPRQGDDAWRLQRNTGFVAFMRREHAEKAKHALDGQLLHDHELRLGWGKSITVPAMPMPSSAAEAAATFIGNEVAPPQAPHTNVAIAAAKAAAAALAAPNASGNAVAAAAAAAAALSAAAAAPCKASVDVPSIVVQAPTDSYVRFIIDTMACYVLRDGCAFEQTIMEREASNPAFGFLFDLSSPEHDYYRWRLWSLACGDSLRTWRVEPFVMVAPGPSWVPPALTAVVESKKRALTAAQRGAMGPRDVDGEPLSDMQREKLQEQLKSLSMGRDDISDVMVFALDHAEAAGEVVDVLTKALCDPDIPLPTKVAHLFAISDILHNSTAPVRNASRYRSLLEAALPDVFESLQATYRQQTSRMGQEMLRRHVLRVLRVWRNWFIFSDDLLNGLQATFLRAAAAEFRPNAVLREELQSLSEDDLRHRAKRNGLSMQGGTPAIMERFLHLDYYLHGEEVQEGDGPAGAAAAEHRKENHSDERAP